MKLGCCASIEQAHTLLQAGFDFIECPVTSLMPEKSAAVFANVLEMYKNSPLPVEVFNILLPGDLKIVGKQVDQDQIRQYMEVALDRVKEIGAEIVVFGSGSARSCPPDFSRKTAKQQIIDFLKNSARIAKPLGITIVIEPLNKQESNLINSIPEAVQLAKTVNHSSIQVLADFYHMQEEQDPLENMIANQSFIKHIHVADTGRTAPGTGHYPYEDFAENLQQFHSKPRISIECNWTDFEQEVFQAFKFLKTVFQD